MAGLRSFKWSDNLLADERPLSLHRWAANASVLLTDSLDRYLWITWTAFWIANWIFKIQLIEHRRKHYSWNKSLIWDFRRQKMGSARGRAGSAIQCCNYWRQQCEYMPSGEIGNDQDAYRQGALITTFINHLVIFSPWFSFYSKLNGTSKFKMVPLSHYINVHYFILCISNYKPCG